MVIINIETLGLGAGSYPEEPESNEKCYIVDFDASIKGYGVIYATNEGEARERALRNDFDDVIDTFAMEIEDITNIREE